MLRKPEGGECPEYYFTYIDLVDGAEDVLASLESDLGRTRALLEPLSDGAGSVRYREDRWSIREVLGHVIDAERVFAYRAFAFARGDEQAIPGMDQDAYAEESNAGDRWLLSLLDEFEVVRRASVALFRSFPEEFWDRTGTASGFDFTVRSFPFIVLGHERHHRALLTDRYLPLVENAS